MQRRILIAGIGNIFLGDDAFGCEVSRALSAHTQPEGVRIVDFGIRGFDLVFALLEHHDLVILIDATSQGGSPGSLYLIEPVVGTESGPDIHRMDPMKALTVARS